MVKTFSMLTYKFKGSKIIQWFKGKTMDKEFEEGQNTIGLKKFRGHMPLLRLC